MRFAPAVDGTAAGGSQGFAFTAGAVPFGMAAAVRRSVRVAPSGSGDDRHQLGAVSSAPLIRGGECAGIVAAHGEDGTGWHRREHDGEGVEERVDGDAG